jgi:hypothetical protein
MAIGIFEKYIKNGVKNNPNKTRVTLRINDLGDLYNRFSITNNSGKINDEIINYLRMESENVPKPNSLIITIKANENLKGKIELIEDLIRENIKNKITKLTEQIRKANRNFFVLSLVGMVLIGITQIFQVAERRYSFNEFMIVMSWVFMWKAVEIFFFERIKLIKEKAILGKIYFSEIITE